MSELLRKEKERIKVGLKFMTPEQVAAEMDKLAEYFKVDKSQANLEETRRLLSKGKSLTDELISMRDEER